MDKEREAQGPTEAVKELARVQAEAFRAGAVMSFSAWLEWTRLQSDQTGWHRTTELLSDPEEFEALLPPMVRDPVPPRPGVVVAYLTYLFRYAEAALANYDEEDVERILYVLVNETMGDAISRLHDPSVPEADRVACADAMGTFLTTYMAEHCAPVPNCWNTNADRLLPGTILNSRCFMWWDSLAIHARPNSPQARAIDEALLRAMVRQLASPNIAVQESGLHGLGHWHLSYPEVVVPAIDKFLTDNPHSDPRLLAYARAARQGCIQ